MTHYHAFQLVQGDSGIAVSCPCPREDRITFGHLAFCERKKIERLFICPCGTSKWVLQREKIDKKDRRSEGKPREENIDKLPEPDPDLRIERKEGFISERTFNLALLALAILAAVFLAWVFLR